MALILHLIALGVSSTVVRYYWDELVGDSDLCPLLSGCRMVGNASMDAICSKTTSVCTGDGKCCDDCENRFGTSTATATSTLPSPSSSSSSSSSSSMRNLSTRMGENDETITIEFVNELTYTYTAIHLLYTVLVLRFVVFCWHLNRDWIRAKIPKRAFKVAGLCASLTLLIIFVTSVSGLISALIVFGNKYRYYLACQTVTMLHLSTAWIYVIILLEYVFVKLSSERYSSMEMKSVVRCREKEISGENAVSPKPRMNFSIVKKVARSFISFAERISLLWWIAIAVYCVGVVTNWWHAFHFSH